METELPAASLEQLPLFPLPDVVLFPGTLMPLHIFEQRYRDMTRDVIAGDRLIAIARLRPGYENDYYGRPPVYETCGVGVVAADDEARRRALQPGRPGSRPRDHRRRAAAGRGRIVGLRVRVLPGSNTSRPELLVGAHGQLVALCDRLSANLGDAGERLQNLVRASTTPAECADVVAAAVVTDADERQELLEQLDPATGWTKYSNT